jgi:transposase
MKKVCKLIKKLELLLKQLNSREYLHHFGPKKYKLKEHLFALLFMQIAKLSFRRVSYLLIELGFYVPSYSALCKSRKRISSSLFEKLLNSTNSKEHENVSLDSTGISVQNPSAHFIKRIDRKIPVKNFVKLSVFFDIDNRKFLAIKVRAKPRHDVKDFDGLFRKVHKFKNFYADTAYDAESIHEKCFDNGIQTFIKPRKNVKRGFYRRKQMKNYSEKMYHQRSLVETGFSILKRKYGGFTLTKSAKSAKAELYLRTIASNLNWINS